MRLLVVEDEVKMAAFIKKGLVDAGFEVDIAENSIQAESNVKLNPYDLMIMDVMLPDRNGFETVKSIRNQGFQNPILMLTALSTTKDKINGFDSGADDYLTKPYAFEELLVRIRALMRRSHVKTNTSLHYADLEMDLIHRKVKRGGIDIELTNKEFTLLEFFMKNPEKVLSRAVMTEEVWKMRFDCESNVIDVYMNVLRKKIDSPYPVKLLNTVVGVGYVLKKN